MTSLDWRISLSPISKFAAATSTIIRTNAVTAKHDYKRLYTNGVITTYVLTDRMDDVRGQMIATNTDQVKPWKTFEDFADYIYPSKQSEMKSRSRVPISESTMPRLGPQDNTAIVADWVRETGEAHDEFDQDFQSAASQALDSFVSDQAAPRLTEVESVIEPRKARSVQARDLLDDDYHHPAQGQNADFQVLGAGFSRQEAPQKYAAYGGELWARDTISPQRTGQITNGSSLDLSRPNPIPCVNSALADLVGLTIPTCDQIQTSDEPFDHIAQKVSEYSTLMPCLQPSRDKHGSQIGTRDSRQTTGQVNTSDLLDMDEEDALQHLMTPMVPVSGLQQISRGHSPPREYYRTMGQKVSRGGQTREKRQDDTEDRASPSPPPSARRRSKIPIRSATPGPGTQCPRRVTAQSGSAIGREKSMIQVQGSTGIWNSQLRGGWNKGLSGEQFGEVTLTSVLRASVEKRLYFEQALEDCLVDMASRARILAGKVSMEIVFGRIVLENIDEDVVNFGGVDSFEPNYDPLRLLQELATFNEANLRLHNTLSLDGNDANMLKNIPWTPDPTKKWVLDDTEAFYDLNCRDVSTNCCFTIQIDAKTFAYSFESQRYGLVDVAFIHCPDRSWDLNACLRATDTVYFEEKYGEFASSIVESLTIS